MIITQETLSRLFTEIGTTMISSGWVDYRQPKVGVPETVPPSFEEDLLGECAIVVLAYCMADTTKIRLIAHISGNLSPVFPYLNAEVPQAMYCREAETLTYMDQYRMISLYERRLTIAKADELVDGWRSLESIRCLVNDTWRRRASIRPSYERRRKPPALEIYRRLPRTNCGACGEPSCMAFAVRLWSGAAHPSLCLPVFSGEQRHLKAPLIQICSGLGMDGELAMEEEAETRPV